MSVAIGWPCMLRILPRNGSFFKGTDIEAVGVGHTKAFYGNSVHLEAENAFEEDYFDGDWFWIEVVEAAP